MTQATRYAAQAPQLGPALRHWGNLGGPEGAVAPGDWIRSDAQLFRGQTDRYHLDLLQVDERGLVVERTAQHILQTPRTGHIIVIQLDGHSLLHAADRPQAVELRPGTISYGNPKIPYRWTFPEPMTLMMLRATTTAMPLTPGTLSPLVGRPFDATAGYAQLAVNLARQVLTDEHLLTGTTGGRVLSDVANMFTTILTEALDGLDSADAFDGGHPALRRVMDYVETHLHTDLRVAQIAEALHMSPRYIQTLFQAQQLTVSGWIRQRRLETIRDVLADPAWAHADILTIACAHGFTDHSHFSRVFKAQFGLTPSQWRNATLSVDPPRTADSAS